MKNIKGIILLIAIMLICVSCGNNDTAKQPNSSKTSANSSVTESKKENTAEAVDGGFKNDSISIALSDNARLIAGGTYYSFVYNGNEGLYLTLNDSAGDPMGKYSLYRIDAQGKKEKIADESWNCYEKDGALYYVKWEDRNARKYKLIMNKNGKETIIADNFSYTFYGDEGIYYKSGSDLYYVTYGKTEGKKILTAEKSDYSYYFEYNKKLWAFDGKALYNFNEDFSEKKEVFAPKAQSGLFTVRNNYIYFVEINRATETAQKLIRYSIADQKTEQLSAPISDSLAFNFTDDYCYYALENKIYCVDSSFSGEKMIAEFDGEIDWIAVSDNRIFVKYFIDDNGKYKEKTVEISTDGKIIKNFD